MSDDLTSLLESISIQGAKVRDLKTAKADETLIQTEVNKLLQLKAKLPKDFKEAKPDKPKVDERAAKKEARRLAREQGQGQSKEQEVGDSIPVVEDVLKEVYGDVKLLQSTREDKKGRNYVRVKTLEKAVTGEVWVRAYLHTVRGQSKMAFVLLRQGIFTIQGVITQKDAAKFAAKVPTESVVDVCGTVVSVPSPTKASQCNVEIQVKKFFVISRATSQLAFQVIDAGRSEAEIAELEARGETVVRVGLDTRLDNRVLDLRTPFSQAVFKIGSALLQYMREFLVANDFTEINTPKLLGGASEGGAEVFKVKYFEKDAFLAQSPQLHKQMAAACSGLERVFEVAPVFRAENSNTNRHLCEFTGIDLEMAFNEHYHEILDVFSDFFHYIFTKVLQNKKSEIETVNMFNAFDPLIFVAPAWIDKSKIAGKNGGRTLRIEFVEAIQLLRAAGVGPEEQGEFDDLSTPVEKKLGALVKEKYGVDFYFLDKFPMAPRPFYTMPCPEHPKLSNSYDFFLRGQEIMSGAQRVHDATLLEERIKQKGIPAETLRFYIDSFKNGALPHGGGGIGLERVIMLFLSLPNIRLCRMFPRDPVRLMP